MVPVVAHAHTHAGTPADPGLMVLCLAQIFREREARAGAGVEDCSVTCSYLEVYNEVRQRLLIHILGC